jgi:hypothetical protein
LIAYNFRAVHWDEECISLARTLSLTYYDTYTYIHTYIHTYIYSIALGRASMLLHCGPHQSYHFVPSRGGDRKPLLLQWKASSCLVVFGENPPCFPPWHWVPQLDYDSSCRVVLARELWRKCPESPCGKKRRNSRVSALVEGGD